MVLTPYRRGTEPPDSVPPCHLDFWRPETLQVPLAAHGACHEIVTRCLHSQRGTHEPTADIPLLLGGKKLSGASGRDTRRREARNRRRADGKDRQGHVPCSMPTTNHPHSIEGVSTFAAKPDANCFA